MDGRRGSHVKPSPIHRKLGFAFTYEGFPYNVCSSFQSIVVLQTVKLRTERKRSRGYYETGFHYVGEIRGTY